MLPGLRPRVTPAFAAFALVSSVCSCGLPVVRTLVTTQAHLDSPEPSPHLKTLH